MSRPDRLLYIQFFFFPFRVIEQRFLRTLQELLEKRAKLFREFQEYREKRRKDWEKNRKRRLEMRSGSSPFTTINVTSLFPLCWNFWLHVFVSSSPEQVSTPTISKPATKSWRRRRSSSLSRRSPRSWRSSRLEFCVSFFPRQFFPSVHRVRLLVFTTPLFIRFPSLFGPSIFWFVVLPVCSLLFVTCVSSCHAEVPVPQWSSRSRALLEDGGILPRTSAVDRRKKKNYTVRCWDRCVILVGFERVYMCLKEKNWLVGVLRRLGRRVTSLAPRFPWRVVVGTAWAALVAIFHSAVNWSSCPDVRMKVTYFALAMDKAPTFVILEQWMTHDSFSSLTSHLFGR